ncbi:MAG: response regulator [Micavibrio sp.]|nr:response regulator [Micavibrio sp.]
MANQSFSGVQKTAPRIVVAEDEPGNLALLKEFLTDAGYLVEGFENGQDAWDWLEKNQDVDVVVTDRNMPKMDGLSLAQHLFDHKRLRNIPVILQTWAATREEIAEGIRAGVYYYLTKPYDEQALLTLVRSALKDSAQRSSFEQRISRQQLALGSMQTAHFKLTSLQEAENIALLLSGAFPRTQLAAEGLYELMANAVEHGMLGIGYEQKKLLMKSGGLDAEIARRLTDPANADKHATVTFTRNGDRVHVTVRDDGPGFNWKPFLEIEPSRATEANGRGIAKAYLVSFDNLLFEEKGNKVTAIGQL